MNNFTTDDNWQREVRNNILAPYYKSVSHESRFVFLDKGKLADRLQREFAIDTIVQGKNNAVFGIEEKIVRWPGYTYSAYTLEIMSCSVPGRERKGWMYTATCDFLFYCFVQADGKSIVAHIIPFPKLQTWFFENERYQAYRSSFTDQINKTETKIVPIKDVWQAIPECKKRFILS